MTILLKKKKFNKWIIFLKYNNIIYVKLLSIIIWLFFINLNYFTLHYLWLFLVILSYLILGYFWLCEAIIGYFWVLKVISSYVIIRNFRLL